MRNDKKNKKKREIASAPITPPRRDERANELDRRGRYLVKCYKLLSLIAGRVRRARDEERKLLRDEIKISHHRVAPGIE